MGDKAVMAATIVLTRSAEDNAPLRRELAARGHVVLEVPTACVRDIGPEPSADVVRQWAAQARAIAFTSRNGVQGFCRLLGAEPLLAALEGGALIAAVGRATAQVLAEAGIAPVLALTEPMTGSHLAEALADRLETQPDAWVLAVQGRHARPELVQGLALRGVPSRVAVVYENAVPEPPAAELLRACALADAVYVAAPSAADRLLAWAPELRDRAFVAIGPTTAAELRRNHGIEASQIAANPGLAAAVDAIERALAA